MAIFFYIHRCMFYFNKLEIIGFMNLNRFFYFYFVNMDISINTCVIDLKFSVWVLKVPLKAILLFYVKKRVTFCVFLKCKLLHFIK